MKRVNIRKFQHRLYDVIDDIPFIVTRSGKDKYIILNYDPRIIDYVERIKERDEENKAGILDV